MVSAGAAFRLGGGELALLPEDACLLPLLTLPTGTDGGLGGSELALLVKAACLLPLLTLLTGTDAGLVYPRRSRRNCRRRCVLVSGEGAACAAACRQAAADTAASIVTAGVTAVVEH